MIKLHLYDSDDLAFGFAFDSFACDWMPLHGALVDFLPFSIINLFFMVDFQF